jgi:hypothetical protein
MTEGERNLLLAISAGMALLLEERYVMSGYFEKVEAIKDYKQAIEALVDSVKTVKEEVDALAKSKGLDTTVITL